MGARTGRGEDSVGGRRPRGIDAPPRRDARLLGTDAVWGIVEQVEAAERAAEEFGCGACLKGAPTIVAHPWGETFFNLTGNHGLAKGDRGRD